MQRFEEDITEILTVLMKDADSKVRDGLIKVRDQIIVLHTRNMLKINHTVMELICAKHLLEKGYSVDVEQDLEWGEITLSCDLYAEREGVKHIVEIETGFVPPDHALDPITYRLTRITSKISRYSGFADTFGLGTVPYHILQIPLLFLKSSKERDEKEIKELKDLCDPYYRRPPLSYNDLKQGRLDIIYVIDVDSVAVSEVEPRRYVEV